MAMGIWTTKALEAELGLEWWRQTELAAFLPLCVVERTLSFLHRANAMASLAHLQLSAPTKESGQMIRTPLLNWTPVVAALFVR